MRFEPKRHLIKVQGGRMYLPVSARLIWFRNECPDWGIETEPIAIDMEKQYAIFRAKIFNAEGRLMAVGTKREDVRGFPDFLEKAETGAVGRALALCGFGTQFAPELDEVDAGRFVDSPSGPRGDQQQQPARPQQRPQAPTQHPAAHTPDDLAARRSEAPAHHGDADPDQPQCTQCSKPLTRSQQELSIRHFGEALCPGCQKQRAGHTQNGAKPQAPAGGAS